MSKHKYEFKTCISTGTDGEPNWREHDVTICYDATQGAPPSGLSGPPENSDPGWGGEVNIVKVLDEDGNEVSGALFDYITEMVDGGGELIDMLLQDAAEVDDGERDAAMERRGEEMREAKW